MKFIEKSLILPKIEFIDTMGKDMKTDIHPTYFDQSVISCACGNDIKAGSTKEKMNTEICSKCHPFYTGREGAMIDITGRVEKFKNRQAKSTSKKDSTTTEKKVRVSKNKKSVA